MLKELFITNCLMIIRQSSLISTEIKKKCFKQIWIKNTSLLSKLKKKLSSSKVMVHLTQFNGQKVLIEKLG